VTFKYKRGVLTAKGRFGYQTKVRIVRVKVLGFGVVEP
jgi:hypothetical protein